MTSVVSCIKLTNMFLFVVVLASVVCFAHCGNYGPSYQPMCGPYQEYKDCGTSCPLTCNNIRNRPQVCPLICVKGCFCVPGYVWEDKVGGRCVPQEQCQPRCGYNETYADSNINCQTCDNVCVENPNPGCYCKKEYVLNRITGQCVLPYDCPKLICNENELCPANEILSRCKNPCEATCDTPQPPVCNFLVCNDGCICREPLIRDGVTGNCIEPKYCPVSCKDPNAVPTDCAPACPVTCQNRSPQPCTKNCLKGCICRKGYIKDEVSGKCVHVSECPTLTY